MKLGQGIGISQSFLPGFASEAGNCTARSNDPGVEGLCGARHRRP
jgi:hypothetical protein